ncbi:MAG: CBS domain-containing protein [Acidimicrobiia bacterium]
MKVAAILDRKGHDIHTVPPDATVAEVSRLLTTHRVGALVVSNDGQAVTGIVSERDVVRRLAAIGPDALEESVASVMTTAVVTCSPDDTTEGLMAVVTEHRIRHIPVIEDGQLVGVVSIGDIVAVRVRELEDETSQLRGYITAG